MKIGYFSPLPPAKTGVADYSTALIPELRKFAGIELNRPGSVNLYHIGNNQLHREIYSEALRNPGVVVLHDAVLQHFMLGTLSQEEYVREFTYNYGRWSSDLGVELWRGRARSAADVRYFCHPMLRRVAESSQAVIVHNQAAAQMVRAHVPSARIIEIPLLFPRPPVPSFEEIQTFRTGIGLRPRSILFGIFGYLRETKRLLPVLRCFARLRAEMPDARLLIAGEYGSEDLRRAVEPMLPDSVIRLGYAGIRDFWIHAHAVDACINLRYPSAGESSAITIHMMGIAKPVIVTAGVDVSHWPEGLCLPVDIGPAEEEMLRHYLIWLYEFQDYAQEIGRRAAQHISKFHEVHAVARSYFEALESLRSR
ncbi:MAG: hypothetical protein ACRD7E_29060 [Bryobacteraceae bacterium]